MSARSRGERTSTPGSRAARQPGVVFPPSVTGVDLLLTPDCNLGCDECFQTRTGRRRMPWRLLRAALDALAGPPPRQVTVSFTGGEPLLAFDLVARAVAHVEESPVLASRVRFAVVTNGTRLDRATAGFFARHRFALRISDHGPALPGAAASRLEDVLAAIAADHPLFFAVSVSVSLVVSSATVGALAGRIDALVRRGVRRIDLAPLFTHDPGWSATTSAALDRQLALVFRDQRVRYATTGEVPLSAFRKHRAGGRARPFGDALCGIGAGRHLAIDPWGTVSPCPATVASLQPGGAPLLRRCLDGLSLGRLDDPAFPGRLARLPEAARELRLFDGREAKRSPLGRCARCASAAECGVCPISIAHVPGSTDPDLIPESQCAFFRSLGKWRRRFPLQPHPLEALAGPARGLSGPSRLRLPLAGEHASGRAAATRPLPPRAVPAATRSPGRRPARDASRRGPRSEGRPPGSRST